MREIKFRAWDKKLKKMFNQDFFIKSNFGEIFLDCDPHGVDMSNRVRIYPNDRSMILMQYTGLKANGKEIYEGDVVRPIIINNTIADGQVCFEDGCFTVVQLTSSGMPNYDCLATRTNFEIIGNIYENPELLSR